MASITLMLTLFTGLISFLAFQNQDLRYRLVHNPYHEVRNREYYRLLTSGFIHADWIHLGINLLVLWNFGGIIEQYYRITFGPSLGSMYYLALYILGILFANLPSFVKHQHHALYNALGASGAVAGLIFTFILFNPCEQIYFYFFPMPGFVFGILYLAYSSYAARHADDNIGHDAHFFGAVFGLVFTSLVEPGLLSAFIYKLQNCF